MPSIETDLESGTRKRVIVPGCMVEYEPHCRMVLMNRNQNKMHYWLSFPYMQFTKSNQKLYVTFSKAPVNNETREDWTVLYFPLLPDIRFDCEAAIGCGAVGVTELDKLISLWWSYYMTISSQWKGCQLLSGTLMKNYKKWEQMTRNNPEFIMDVEFKEEVKPSAVCSALERLGK